MAKIYLVGSLRNPAIPDIASALRIAGHYVFDDWFAAGERADDAWRAYEIDRGRTYREAMNGHAATHVFRFDKKHLDLAEIIVLALPAGKSGHLELGYGIGSGKRGYILLDKDYDRWDVMYKFADAVVDTVDELIKQIGE